MFSYPPHYTVNSMIQLYKSKYYNYYVNIKTLYDVYSFPVVWKSGGILIFDTSRTPKIKKYKLFRYRSDNENYSFKLTPSLINSYNVLVSNNKSKRLSGQKK